MPVFKRQKKPGWIVFVAECFVESGICVTDKTGYLEAAISINTCWACSAVFGAVFWTCGVPYRLSVWS